METKENIRSQSSRKTRLAAEESLLQPVESDVESEIEAEETMKYNTHVIIGVYIVVIALGILTGFFLSKGNVGSSNSSQTSKSNSANSSTSSKSAATDFDAVGVLEKGGSGGEGTHKLIREGGPSQTAYLMSSMVDLDEYVGKKIRIWGMTMQAKKVSWLMDVSKVEISE